jgi:hypothetical protein
VRYLRHEQNRGATWNFNEVARAAESAFFAWHAADDCARPQCYESCVAMLERNPQAAAAYTLAASIDEESRPLSCAAQPRPTDSPVVAERFASCLTPFPYSENLIYGVMRVSMLRQTRLLAPFPGSDRAFCAELALLGPLIRIDEPLFVRRLTNVNRSEADTEHYNAGVRRRLLLREWRILRHNLQSVRRIPRPAGGRLALYGAVLRNLRQRRADFLYELKAAIGALGRSTASPSR